MLKEVLASLEAGTWPDALVRALAAWRETRAPALADLVDWIASRIAFPPPYETQADWIAAAWRHDPSELGRLVATLPSSGRHIEQRVYKKVRWRAHPGNPLEEMLLGNGGYSDMVERLAALLEWPDDPRLSRVLVALVLDPIDRYSKQRFTVYEAIGDRLVTIGDVRVIPVLERCALEPRGRSQDDRDLQVEISRRVLAGLAKRSPPADPGPLYERCAAIVAPPPPPPRPTIESTVDLDALWREVAANPDDIAIRSVLGDALVQIGDSRGELIVMSCNARTPGRPLRGSHRDRFGGRAKTMARQMWDEWLGDLALVVARRGSEFHRGMLEVIAVGHQWTPPWAWTKAHGHRELAAVHTVRPGWAPPDRFAELVAALPRDPRRLAIDSPDALTHLANARPRLATEALELRRDRITYPRRAGAPLPRTWSGTGTDRPLLAACRQAADLAPDLTEIALDVQVPREQLVELLPALPTLFPKLARIVVARRMANTPDLEATIRPFRLVELTAPLPARGTRATRAPSTYRKLRVR